MTRASGVTVWDASGRTFLDCTMALGAVALGYAHPEVTEAAMAAAADGTVGPLAPVHEERLAGAIARAIPWAEQVRFLKTGAEAVAAAVRIARVSTGRDLVLGCGYHGWLDWCQEEAGVPGPVRGLFSPLPFDDPEAARRAIRGAADRLAAVVVEPVVEAPPSAEWLATLREEADRAGALLVFDEIKTACRIAVGGAGERYGVRPDLVVLGKALANGFPLAVVGGSAGVMAAVDRTWISSTLATEMVSLAAAEATLAVMLRERVPAHLTTMGVRLRDGLAALAGRHPNVATGVAGIPEMCHLRFTSDEVGMVVARQCARRGLLWKRGAYNFVSLAHGAREVDRALAILDDALTAAG